MLGDCGSAVTLHPLHRSSHGTRRASKRAILQERNAELRKVERADRKRPSNQKNERVDRQLLNDAAGATKVPIDQRIGATIRRVRREQGLTLANVASAADISSSMLSRFETGKSTASLAQLERLCVTFGVDLALFLNAIEQAKREPEFIKASARKEVMRAGTKYGHTFHSLSQIKGSGKDFEIFPR